MWSYFFSFKKKTQLENFPFPKGKISEKSDPEEGLTEIESESEMARVGDYVRVSGEEGLVERIVDDQVYCK